MKKTITKREATLVIIFLSVVSFLGYFYFRYGSQARQTERLESGNKQLKRDLDSFKLKKEPRISSKMLQNEIDRIDEVLEPVEAKIGEFEDLFASLDSAGNIQKIKVEISSLAREHHVLITENVPYENIAEDIARSARGLKKGQRRDLHNLNVLRHLYEKQYLDRPLRKITLRARYMNLLRFIEGFNHLSGMVINVRLELEAVQSSELTAGPQIIEAQLILVL